MKFIVSIPEVHIAKIYVEADNEEQAKEIAEEQYSVTGVPDELEYSHTLDSDQYEVEDNE